MYVCTQSISLMLFAPIPLEPSKEVLWISESANNKPPLSAESAFWPK